MYVDRDPFAELVYYERHYGALHIVKRVWDYQEEKYKHEAILIPMSCIAPLAKITAEMLEDSKRPREEKYL